MGRKKLNKEWWAVRLTKEDRERLESLILSLGFSVKRKIDGVETIQAGGTEFVEAIAHGDIVLYKKVQNPIDDQK